MVFLKQIKTLLTGRNVFSNHATTRTQKWSSITTKENIEFEEANIDLINVTLFFKNNIVVNVIPDVYNYYNARYYNIDGVKYDTKNISDVTSIPLTKSDFVSGTPVYNLEYLLRKRAREERKLDNNELAYSLLLKGTELMKFTNMRYNITDYLLIVKWCYEDGYFDAAEIYTEKLHQNFPTIFNPTLDRVEHFNTLLSRCRELSTDYIECMPHGACCEECSILQNRVYSISGNDKRFPKLPKITMKYGGFHEGCRCLFMPYFLTSNTIQDLYGYQHDAIAYSNRPLVDTRTATDKENYKKYLETPKCDANYYEALYKQRGADRLEYRKILYHLPQYAPKSFSGYMRMKKNKTKNFMKLYEIANENDIHIKL